MGKIMNPILKGFNPDPSIIRVGDDYYIATSTFEWFPGVQIYHSRDLKNWQLIAHPLNRVSQIDLSGVPTSGGVWAPCLSYDKGTFYLIYTNVRTRGIFKDTHNYLITAEDIKGEWSDPIYLNSTGFDPSLFHDEDGRKWLVNMTWDPRSWKNKFGGVLLQEYSPLEKRLVGEPINIFKGTSLGKTEGPHLYKINGYYYLIAAEGGTGLGHSVTLARAKNIYGPYEVAPNNPILTSSEDPTLVLQKSGHADLVETQNGEWYMVHLCSRPIPSRGLSPLGRETSIQKVCWTEEGWLELSHGGNKPAVEIEAPEIPEHKFQKQPERDDFNSEILNIHFNTLRIPLGEESLSLKERPGYLRLKGRESLHSKFHQSLVARRVQSFKYKAETCVEFEPDSFKQMAGLVIMYDTEDYYYLRISRDEEEGKCIGIISCNNGSFSYPVGRDISIEGFERCCLKAEINYDKLQFYYSKDGEIWTSIGYNLDAALLSDEYCNEGAFTGTMIGICCQDLSGAGKYADFDYFEYIEQ
jgi:xylan 1,4-beta-xylosidase